MSVVKFLNRNNIVSFSILLRKLTVNLFFSHPVSPKTKKHSLLSPVSDLIRFVPFSHCSSLTPFSNYLYTVHLSEHSAVATSFRSTKPNKQHLSLSLSVLSFPLPEPSISNSSCYQVRFSLLFSFKILLTYLSLSLNLISTGEVWFIKIIGFFFSFFIFPQFFFFFRLFSNHLYEGLLDSRLSQALANRQRDFLFNFPQTASIVVTNLFV